LRVFKNKRFARFARKEHIGNAKLCEAVRAAEAGKIDANYGGGVIKQRIARPNQGTSGGYRSVILYRRSEKAFFIYGFPKNERENIDEAEERAFKELAKITFAFSEGDLAKLLNNGTYTEVKCDD